MKLIGHLTIRLKLMLLLSLVLFPLIYLAFSTLLREQRALKDLDALGTRMQEVQRLTQLVQSIQQEWIFSFDQLNTPSATHLQRFRQQRLATDVVLNELLKQENTSQRWFTSDLTGQLREARRLIDIANSRRDAGTLDWFALRHSFAQIMEAGLDEIDATAAGATDAAVKNQIRSVYHLSSFKEQFSKTLLTARAIMVNGGSDAALAARLQADQALYAFHQEKFRSLAGDQLAAFDRVMAGDSVVKYVALVDEMLGNVAYRHSGAGYLEWGAVGAAGLRQLYDFEKTYLVTVGTSISERVAEARRGFINVATLLLLVVVLAMSYGIYFTRSLSGGIGQLREASEKIARGETDMALRIRSRDELGQLADAFGEVMRNARLLSEVAERIGQGKYEVEVPLRGEKDLLGASLDQMKHNLAELSRKNAEREWLLTGNSRLNDVTRGEKEVKQLAQEIITELCHYLGAQIGAIYLKETHEYVLVGSFAYYFRKENTNVFAPGQGLVGQAALEKQPIVFSELPENYLKIQSGLGSDTPRHLLVYPFQFDGDVLGVLELGTTAAFSELRLKLLELMAENIGIAFNTAMARTRMKELLEETQRQAEELEAQQEELRQSNEELTEKTELLERSETELRAQQEELQQTNEELEEKANLLEEQKIRLEDAKMELENKARELEVTSRYKSEFLANMSHELRTPLNSILILSQLMAENKNNTLGDKEIEFAKNISSSGTDLLNLINEILDLSKIEAGKMELQVEPVPLEEVSQDLRKMFKDLAETKAIEFECKQEPGVPPTLYTDRLRLEQIVRNLLSNAFKFTRKGGQVLLSVHRPPKGVAYQSRSLQQAPAVVAFSVKDTGIGIPEGKLEVIFEAFQQADGSTKRKYGGTGLGLSISRELALALGGEITVQSTENIGSTFTLYLPVQYAGSEGIMSSRIASRTVHSAVTESLPIPPHKPAEEVHLEEIPDDRHQLDAESKKVLILEDDPEFAGVLLEFVRERGYKGVVALQGNVGLSYARMYTPDAILLDMKLPVMDGHEVLKHLKADPELRHIPVQIISGYGERAHAMELGAFDFLMKPVSRDDLRSAFERIEDFCNRKIKKLLIIEDNELQSKAISELVGNHDLKTVIASSGSEGYELLLQQRFDCVIIDLGLPDMPGVALLEKIKNNDTINRTPLIVYTGRDLSKEEHHQLMKLANTVVLKTANSKERLLDETMLFLHRVESSLPKEKQNIIRSLHKASDVLPGKKILVVDDDIRNIYSLTNALEEEGLDCITAEDGKVALAKLKANPDITMVLMDVMMPEMDGLEATKAIRKMDRYAKLPIIALTAKAMKGDREKCLQAGMSDYISKPVNVEQLLSLMRVWLYK